MAAHLVINDEEQNWRLSPNEQPRDVAHRIATAIDENRAVVVSVTVPDRLRSDSYLVLSPQEIGRVAIVELPDPDA